jgi:CRP/FNR family cyclic AMP-dependent transcriptional regulator
MAVYPTGKVLYAEGQPAKGVFILCNGRAKTSTASGRGSLMILKIAQAGEALGLEATLANLLHQETAQLLEPCQVKFIPKKELRRYLFGNADAALKTALQIADDCNSAREQVRRIGFSISGTQKLAQLLMMWADESKCKHAHESTFIVPYTHEELAQMIGCTRETVTRVLNKFRQNNVIEIQARTFVVKDLKQLARFTGE